MHAHEAAADQSFGALQPRLLSQPPVAAIGAYRSTVGTEGAMRQANHSSCSDTLPDSLDDLQQPSKPRKGFSNQTRPHLGVVSTESDCAPPQHSLRQQQHWGSICWKTASVPPQAVALPGKQAGSSHSRSSQQQPLAASLPARSASCEPRLSSLRAPSRAAVSGVYSSGNNGSVSPPLAAAGRCKSTLSPQPWGSETHQKRGTLHSASLHAAPELEEEGEQPSTLFSTAAAARTDAGLDFWPSGPASAAAHHHTGMRILALGRVLCRAANGDIFPMEVGHVQRMLLYKCLRACGVDPEHPSYKRMERAVATNQRRGSDGGIIRSRMVTKVSPQGVGFAGIEEGSPSRPASPDPVGRPASPGKPGAPQGLMLPKPLKRSAVAAALTAHAEQGEEHGETDVILDEALLTRLAAMDDQIEALRQQLQEQAAAAKAAKAAAAAAELLPESSSLSASNTRQQQLRRMPNPVYISGVAQADGRHIQGLNTPTGGALQQPHHPHHAPNGVPPQQQQQQPHDPHAVWDDVVNMGDLIVKKQSAHCAAAYEATCRALGITACSQVLQALRSPAANMAHCKLGREGALALASALPSNTVITSLDLRDNALTAEGLSAILQGIAAATGAHLTAARREQLLKEQQAQAARGGGPLGRTASAMPWGTPQPQQQQQMPPDVAAAANGQWRNPAPLQHWQSGWEASTAGNTRSSSCDARSSVAGAAVASCMPGADAADMGPGMSSSDCGSADPYGQSWNQRASTAGWGPGQNPSQPGFDSAVAEFDCQLGAADSAARGYRSSQPGMRSSTAGAMPGLSWQQQQQNGMAYVPPFASNSTFGALPPTGHPSAAAHTSTWRASGGPLSSCTSQHPQQIVRALQQQGPCLFSQLFELDLSGNSLGHQGAKLVAELLDPVKTPGQFLELLRLNKCSIPESGGLLLATALLSANKKLTYLSLSNNSLGNKTAAAFGELMDNNNTLLELDLSWNQIKDEGARGLSRGLAANRSLKRLNLSWNGLENAGGCHLGEMLGQNAGLLKLDLSHVRLGSEACLVLAEGLKANRTLEVLLLNGNNIGEDGARHLMYALHSNKHLQFLGLQGSNLSGAKDLHHGPADFNPASPDGHYSLQLAVAAERAVAVQLADLDQAALSDLMKNITLDGKSISSAKKANWPVQLPARGLLQCDFASTLTHSNLVLMNARQLASLQRQLTQRTMSDKERLGLVSMFAPFVYLSCAQIAEVLSSFTLGPERVTAAVLLFARAADPRSGLEQVLAVLDRRDAEEWRRQLLWYADYCFSYPQGYYVLNLSSPVHAALAHRLKDAAAAAPEGRNWMNLVYEDYTSKLKVPSSRGPPEPWHGVLPSHGVLAFDFFDARTPREGLEALSDQDFQSLLQQKVGVEFSLEGERAVPVPSTDTAVADWQLLALRNQAPDLAVTSAQVATTVQCFKFSPHKVEAAVLLYPRTTDRADEFWAVIYSLSPLEQSCLLIRLGPDTLFNPKRCSHHWLLDLSNPGHEEVAKKLVAMAVAATDIPHIWNLRLKGSKKNMQENQNLWGSLTAESFTPILEFDFMATDAWEQLGKTASDVAAMGTAEKTELRTQQAARLELSRAVSLHPYSSSHMSAHLPEWARYQAALSAQDSKPPWIAAWDQQIRALLRRQAAAGDVTAGSILQDMFDQAAGSTPELSVAQFETALKNWGLNKSDVARAATVAKALLVELAATDSQQNPTSSNSARGMQPGGSASNQRRASVAGQAADAAGNRRAAGSSNMRSSVAGGAPASALNGNRSSTAGDMGAKSAGRAPRKSDAASAGPGSAEVALSRGLTLSEFAAVLLSDALTGARGADQIAADIAASLVKAAPTAAPDAPSGGGYAIGISNRGSVGGTMTTRQSMPGTSVGGQSNGPVKNDGEAAPSTNRNSDQSRNAAAGQSLSTVAGRNSSSSSGSVVGVDPLPLDGDGQK